MGWPWAVPCWWIRQVRGTDTFLPFTTHLAKTSGCSLSAQHQQWVLLLSEEDSVPGEGGGLQPPCACSPVGLLGCSWETKPRTGRGRWAFHRCWKAHRGDFPSNTCWPCSIHAPRADVCLWLPFPSLFIKFLARSQGQPGGSALPGVGAALQKMLLFPSPQQLLQPRSVFAIKQR